MAFRDLEKRLEASNNLDRFQLVLRKIQGDEKFRTTLQYLLSLSSDFEKYGVSKYAIIGGYAVLLHTIKGHGEGVIVKWRGSHDIDVVADDYSLEDALKCEYQFKKNPSHLTPGKFSVEIEDTDLINVCPLDLFILRGHDQIMLEQYSVDDNLWNNVEQIELYGISSSVVSIPELLKMKIEVLHDKDLPRFRDRVDIYQLISVLEKRDTQLSFVHDLTKFQKERLRRILTSTESEVGKMNLYREPSKDYLRKVKKALKK